jgi:hypothetical protein
MEPLIAHPPMEQWEVLHVSSENGVRRLDGLAMPKLLELYADGNPLTTLPWNDLRNLQYLAVTVCDLTELPLWRLPNLRHCWAGSNPDLVEADAHGITSLCDLDLYYCESLVWMDLLGCTSLEEIYGYGCALPQAAVDQVLADLVANGTANGYLQLNGPYNAPPSNPGGIALKNILISRGWTVYTN